LHLMPFHQLGKHKYHRLDLPYPLVDAKPLEVTAEGRALLSAARAVLESTGICTVIGG
jgi:pyruvate-formate lyase-activating enzyme